MVLVVVEWGDGRYCDAGTSTGQSPFGPKDYPDAKERFGKAMEAAQAKRDPTSWVIVKGGKTDRATYYLKQLTPESQPNYTDRNSCRVYAIVDEPNHTPCSHGGVAKAPTRIVDGVDQAWAGEHTRFADDDESKLKMGEMRDYLSTVIPNTVYKGLKKVQLKELYDKEKAEESVREGAHAMLLLARSTY